MRNYVIGIAVLVVVLVGSFLLIRKPEEMLVSKSSPSASSIVEVSPTQEKIITKAELSLHKSKDDCWLAIDGVVYDVTSFIPNHPGKDEILRGCGLDATEYFATKGGKGLPHSKKALDIRGGLKIGVMEDALE